MMELGWSTDALGKQTELDWSILMDRSTSKRANPRSSRKTLLSF